MRLSRVLINVLSFSILVHTATALAAKSGTPQDPFMSVASQMRVELDQRPLENTNAMLQEGFKKLEARITPDSQTKEMVALNLISLMKLYQTLDTKYQKYYYGAPLSKRSQPQFRTQLTVLKRAKRRVFQLAKRSITIFAENQEGSYTQDQDRVLNERLKQFSEIFAACAETVLRDVSIRIKREQQSGQAQNISSFSSRVRRYYESSLGQSPRHRQLFDQFGFRPEKKFLDRLAVYMAKLLSLRRGNPSLFNKQVSLTATVVGAFGYSTIMLPTPTKTALFLGLVSATTAYFHNQIRFAPARRFALKIKPFQSGDALDRTARSCSNILKTRS